jgi:hypothetical protein
MQPFQQGTHEIRKKSIPCFLPSSFNNFCRSRGDETHSEKLVSLYHHVSTFLTFVLVGLSKNKIVHASGRVSPYHKGVSSYAKDISSYAKEVSSYAGELS